MRLIENGVGNLLGEDVDCRCHTGAPVHESRIRILVPEAIEEPADEVAVGAARSQAVDRTVAHGHIGKGRAPVAGE